MLCRSGMQLYSFRGSQLAGTPSAAARSCPGQARTLAPWAVSLAVSSAAWEVPLNQLWGGWGRGNSARRVLEVIIPSEIVQDAVTGG